MTSSRVLKRDIISLANSDNGAPKIANFSWGYNVPNVGTNLSATIDFVRRNLLVVAAAGNENQHWRPGERCNFEPACSVNVANIISVVGLDQSEDRPDLWKKDNKIGSNSAEMFDIAAIAQRVLSTISGNKLAYISGTSQAAAEVRQSRRSSCLRR